MKRFERSDYISVCNFENGLTMEPIKVRSENGKLDVLKILQILTDESQHVIADGDFRNIFCEITARYALLLNDVSLLTTDSLKDIIKTDFT